MKKALISIIGVILVLCVCLGGYAYKEGSDFRESDVILANISIDCIDVGNKTKTEAKNIINAYVNKTLSEKFIIRANNNLYNPTLKELGYSFNVDEVIEKAYSIGRSGNVIEDTLLIYKLGKYNLSLKETRDDSIALKYVDKLANQLYVRAKDASIYKSGSQLNIKSEISGLKLNKEKAKKDLLEALDNDKGKVVFTCEKDIPKIKAKDLKSVNKILATYTTKYNQGKVNRSENLRLASKKINNTTLMPGDTFSFNKIVGPRTEKTGFKNAIVFQDGEEIEGMGGGICQVSSTLFNAILLTDLKITSRRCHSLKVAYVPLGQDAMVSYGASDFRFSNNSKYPVVLFATCGGGRLSFEVWGNSSVWKKCRVVQEKDDTGFKAKVTRYVYSPDGSCVADYVTTSNYMKPKPKKEEQN